MERRPRILVVDRSRPATTVISSLLRREGFEVYAANDGREGLRKAQELRPDLVILDAMMPGMSGYEVCYHLKKDAETAHISVLFLTDKENTEDEAEEPWRLASYVQNQLLGLDLGASDFLCKPVRAKELARRVKALLWAGGLPV